MSTHIAVFVRPVERIAVLAVLIFAFLAALCAPLSAQAFDFGGRAYVDYYGNIDKTRFYESERIRICLAPEISARPFPWLSLNASAVFYTQLLGEPRFIKPSNILREAYLGLTSGPLDLYIGQKLVNWGKVDVLSPLNNVNHSDTTVLSMDNIFESNKADILVQARMYLNDSFDVDLVYVPFFQPNHFDIDEITIEQELILMYPGTETRKLKVNASFKNPEVPLFSEWAHSLHAALNYTSFDFDATFAYSLFRDQYPDFDLSGIKEVISDEGVIVHDITGTATPAYYRVHNIGAGISFYLSDFLISSDIGYKLTPDFAGTNMAIRNNELFWVIQVERLYTVFEKQLRLQVNGFYRQVINAGAKIESDYSEILTAFLNAVLDDYSSQKPPTQIYALLHLDTSFFRETFLVGANFIYGYSESIYKMVPAFYIAPRLTYILSDYVSASAGADIWWGGTHEGFLGRNVTKDNFFVRIQARL